MSLLDHIVIAVPDLDAAMDYYQELMGVDFIIGGRHTEWGTHNAICRVAERSYIELIAKDPSNTAYEGGYWMGLDTIGDKTITRWAIQSNDINVDNKHLLALQPSRANLTRGSRITPNGKMISWLMTIPSEEPVIDIIPFIVDWSASPSHPVTDLPLELSLRKLSFTHPDPHRIQAIFSTLGLDYAVHYAQHASIHLELDSPRGIIMI